MSVCLHIQDPRPRFVFGLGNLQPLVIARLGLDARELLLRGLLGCSVTTLKIENPTKPCTNLSILLLKFPRP